MPGRRRLADEMRRRREAREYHRTMRRCRCGKVWSRSLPDARRKQSLAGDRHGTGGEVGFYRCRFRSWHWTRRSERPEPSRPRLQVPRGVDLGSFDCD